MDKKQILIKVDPEQKERWEEHAEEQREYTSLSQLIRLSVENQIHTEEDSESETDERLFEEIQQLTESVQQLDHKLTETKAETAKTTELEILEQLLQYLVREVQDEFEDPDFPDEIREGENAVFIDTSE